MFQTIVSIAVGCLIAVAVYALLNSGHKEDVEKRRAFLIYRAQGLWPQLDLCAALDCLYALTLREIKSEYAAGNNTDELQDDLVTIQNIRNQLLLEEDANAIVKIKINKGENHDGRNGGSKSRRVVSAAGEAQRRNNNASSGNT
jgi:hypothetical protein